MQRRELLLTTAALTGFAVCGKAAAQAASPLLPQGKMILPSQPKTLTPAAAQASRDRAPAKAATPQTAATAAPKRGNTATAAKPSAAAGQIAPPWGYVKVAQEIGIPAWAMYGVALQESQMKFGERVLPYPWTLCVQGRPERYRSHEQTLAALTRHVRAGITNVDCGSMQVNWRWHKDKFASKADALDYWSNLRVGASILAALYSQHRNWHTAFRLYHTGSDTAANRSRGNKYANSVIRRLARQGVDTKTVLGVSV